MDHTNDPMERVSERVVSRRTLLVTCCSEHVGNNAEGVPWTPTVPSNLRRESRGYQQNNRNTKITIYKSPISTARALFMHFSLPECNAHRLRRLPLVRS